MIITVVNDISRAAAAASSIQLSSRQQAALQCGGIEIQLSIAALKWWNIAARMEVETLLRRRFIFGHEFCIIVRLFRHWGLRWPWKLAATAQYIGDGRLPLLLYTATVVCDQSHYIQVAQGDIFMEQKMRFGLLLYTVAVWTQKKFFPLLIRPQGSQGCQKITFFFYK